VIFPLQFSPEASTLIQGSKFNDMYQVIELISKSLPVNFTLVVKEHKLCVGRREYKFFKKIFNLHNVRLIKEDVDTYQLIKHSKGVITISSSMALEALMLKKPAGIIGRIYFDNLSNVFNFHNMYSLDHDIKKMLASIHNSDEIKALIQTIIECGFEVDMHPETYSGIENLPNIAQYISKYS
jgi:predicted glycosyltransferase